MKHMLPLVLLASLCSGCLLFGSGPKARPLYAIELPDPPPAADKTPADAPVLVLGRVKAAAAASRRDITWSEAIGGGRVGRLEDGMFALDPEETVAAALRTYLPGIGVYAAVVPREVAPRGRDRVMLETWIERFGLERDPQGGVSAVVETRFYLEPSSGGEPAALREIPLTAHIAVSAKKGALPSAPDAAKGLSKALESLLAKLRIELAR